jgi:hypothetical protein
VNGRRFHSRRSQFLAQRLIRQFAANTGLEDAISDNFDPFHKRLVRVEAKHERSKICELPDDVLCLDSVAMGEVCAHDDGAAARHIGEQRCKRSQSSREVSGPGATSKLGQSFCNDLL